MDKLNFHILPIANPDGYIYTWSNQSNIDIRLWRKNRNTSRIDDATTYREGYSVADCVGVDLNRNFDFHWNGITHKNSYISSTKETNLGIYLG